LLFAPLLPGFSAFAGCAFPVVGLAEASDTFFCGALPVAGLAGAADTFFFGGINCFIYNYFSV
jgi:hypothetical protein